MKVGEVIQKTINGSGLEALDYIRYGLDRWKRDQEENLSVGLYFAAATNIEIDGLLDKAVAKGTMTLTVAEDR